MKNDISSEVSKITKKKKRSKRWQRVVTVLAAIVVFCTTYALILPAITRESNPTCGKKEHIHVDSCYASKNVLVCTLTDDKSHTHDDSCYELKPNLDILTCDKEEHAHHEILCFVDPDADREQMADWEKTLPEKFSGIWNQDLLLVAKSQLDYQESEANVQVDSNGNIKGYTRYGDWYGDPYGEWSSTFVAFCMNYAGIPSDFFPYESNSYRLYMELNQLGLYANREDEYTPQIGDIVFFDTTGNGNANRVGIISSFGITEGEASASLTTIEGDTQNDKVENCTYATDDKSIIGYGKLSKAYEEYKKSKITKVFNGKDYTITAKFARDALPDEVELTARELTEKEYDEYTTSANNIIPSDRVISHLRLFDVKFISNGIGVNPTMPVEITVTYKKLPVTATGKAQGITFNNQKATLRNTTGDGKNSTFTTDEFFVLGTVFLDGEFVVTPDVVTTVAKTTTYNQSLLNGSNNLLVYTQSGSDYYAFDGNGNAVRVTIDQSGNIICDTDNPNLLLWTFTPSNGAYLIRNVSNGKYMHAFPNNGSGVTTSGAYTSSVSTANGGIKIRSNNEYAQLNTATSKFVVTNNVNNAATYQLGISNKSTIWFDGTNGGLMSLGGSPNEAHTVMTGSTFTLPDTWQSPTKYNYTLRSWYDTKADKFYAPGETITITENTVFYADWEASSYDIGQFNANVVDTVSTNDFITTHVFDYNFLFNTLSESVSVNANTNSHSETWTLQTGNDSLNYIFRDWDMGSPYISYPDNCNNQNTNGSVYSGLYSEEIKELLFDTDNAFNPNDGSGVVGKSYLGTADHLFQIMTDPNDEHYGYYYYNSALNAASFNQSDKRFYVYDYIERTADSAKTDGEGAYSDFLPLNSPYTNTNGKVVSTYQHNNTTNYMYDAKYNTDGNSVNNVGTNYLFGMSIDMRFYLPDTPGNRDASGEYGNKDMYGKDMHFKFSGDDDVWVLVDGKLVLDIGGIHGIESGDINFSTGVVSVNGSQVGTLDGITDGEHHLTILYLERGSSQSNCAIYFNIAPRYTFSLQKEDVLTRDLLNGAQFTFYMDKECTIPAELWKNRESYSRHEPSSSTFTITDGVANIWGLSAGQTYYMKETTPPTDSGYSCAEGIICISLDKRGETTYSVEMLPDNDGSDPSHGFTVHGFKINEETHEAFLVVTNAQDYVTETTSVTALKEWADNKNHSGDSVTVYLTYTDQNGTVHRIREIQLSDLNEWKHTWVSLPKYFEDGVTEIVYSVEEAYKQGYFAKVEKLDHTSMSNKVWSEAYTFEDGKTYLLNTTNGCLSTTSATNQTFMFVDVETAKNSPLAQWTTTVSGNTIMLINGANQRFTFSYHSWGGYYSYFYPTTSNISYQLLSFRQHNGGLVIGSYMEEIQLFAGPIKSDNTLSAVYSEWEALIFNPLVLTEEVIQIEADSFYYKITNSPLERETSFRVSKNWDIGNGGSVSLYEKLQVTVKLLADGVDTGRTVTLNLKNNWNDVFAGLPYTDENGRVIVYTIEESWTTSDWIPTYGQVITHSGQTPTYSSTITNTYRWGHEYDLPDTGGYGTFMYISGGLLLILSAIFLLYKKRRKEATSYLP